MPGYVIAQMLGGFAGAALVWLFYKDHYDATEDPDTKLGTFCTMPAIEGHKVRNFFCEALASWLLVFVILVFGVDANVAIRSVLSWVRCWKSVFAVIHFLRTR